MNADNTILNPDITMKLDVASPVSVTVWKTIGIMILLGLSPAANAAQTEFKELNLGDRVVTNAYISTATPLDLIVMWDGGGKTFKRQELPAGLKELYPYDASKAGEYLKQQEAEREKRIQQAKLRQQRAVQELKATMLGQRQSHKQRIVALEKELAKVHSQIDAARPRFRRRMTAAEIQDLERLTIRQRELRGQIDDFNERIATIDTRLASLS